MKRSIMLALGAVSLASAVVFASLFAGENGKDDQSIGLDKVPAAVRDAINRATKGAEIEGIETETQDGKTIYDVEVSRDGTDVELAFDENGGLVGFDVEGDEGDKRNEKDGDGEADDAQIVALADIPAAAQEALRKLAGDAKIAEVKVEDEDGVKVYEAAWKLKDVEHEATVTAHGEVVETEQVIAASAAPEAVQKVAAKEFPKGAKVKFEKKTIVLYELEAEIDGQEKEFLVAPTGQQMEIDAVDHEDYEKDEDK